MNPLPPLHAVRAFEAAGRHLSLTRASAELHVTHGAVSRQISRLEGYLGVKLFLRTGGGLVLTDRGRTYHAEVVAALDRLRVGTRRAAHTDADAVVHLNVPPTFAMRWLIPRLAGFAASHRGFTLELSTSLEEPDFERGNCDAAIRRMRRVPKALAGQSFLAAGTIAVCSPRYAASIGLTRVADLARAALITNGTEPDEWERWFRGQRAAPPPGVRTLAFEQLFFALQAAADSLGVALAPEALVTEEIAQGRLVAPLPGRPIGDRAYTIVYPATSPKRAALRVLAHWLGVTGRESGSVRALVR